MSGNLQNQFFVKKWHAVFFGVIAALIFAVHLWHSLGSVTVKQVAELPENELRAVTYTVGPNVFPIGPKHWHNLVDELGRLKGTSDIGRDRTPWGALLCFELDWGEDKRYWLRLRSREELGDRVIANLEEPLGDTGSFIHQGYYDGAPLWNWFHATRPRVKGLAHRTGGPGCPPNRGTPLSPLWPPNLVKGATN